MIDKIVAMLDTLTLEEIDKLPPARQRKLAELLRHWQQLAERRIEQQPKSGVLWDLSNSRHSE